MYTSKPVPLLPLTGAMGGGYLLYIHSMLAVAVLLFAVLATFTIVHEVRHRTRRS